MKAIIMAGGEGTRLRPLTCDIPKPMVPVVNRPVMEHIIRLLKRHGVEEIGVTLQYMPWRIQEYFGSGKNWDVELTYFTEDMPLGTAGSVRNCGKWVDETTLIISGDALTDADLTSALRFHQAKNALATMVIKPCADPLDYGLVIADEQGKVTRFLEKPSWSRVFSDTVNTGIYLLEPECAEMIPKGQKYDFGKQLFPALLADEEPLYAWIMRDYWCDIGDVESYRQAQADAMNGLVRVDIPGREKSPGVWVAEGAKIAPGARIAAPVVIGSEVCIEEGAVIGAETVIGSRCVLQKDSRIVRSVLWEGVAVGRQSSIRGSVLCEQVRVDRGCVLETGTAVGCGTHLMEGAHACGNARIWPDKRVEPCAWAEDSLPGAGRFRSRFLCGGQACGRMGTEITALRTVRLCQALAASTGVKQAAVACWNGDAAQALSHTMLGALRLSGKHTVNMGVMPLSLMRQAMREMGIQCGIHAEVGREGRIARLTPIGAEGCPPDTAQLRAVEDGMLRGEFLPESAGATAILTDGLLFAGNRIFRTLRTDVRVRQISVRLGGGERILQVVRPLLERAGCCVESCNDGEEKAADVTFLFSESGNEVTVYDELGQRAEGYAVTEMLLAERLDELPCPLPLPVDGADWLEDRAAEAERGSLRLSNDAFIQRAAGSDVLFGLYYDPIYRMLELARCLMAKTVPLSRLMADHPRRFRCEQRVACSDRRKGRVLRTLIREQRGARPITEEGMLLRFPGGWTLVRPEEGAAYCRVTTQCADMETARELTGKFVEKIRRMQEGFPGEAENI